jgi:hypothetical protein
VSYKDILEQKGSVRKKVKVKIGVQGGGGEERWEK